MTTAFRRTALLAAAVAVSGSALTGCATGPNQVGAAAIIGDHVISVDDVQQRVDRVVQAEPSAQQLAGQRKLDLVSRELMAKLVLHDLLREAAVREGITVAPEELSQRLAQDAPPDLPADGSVPPEALARELADRAREPADVHTDELLAEKLAEKYIGRISVRFNAAQLESVEEARKLADEIAAQPERSKDLVSAAAGAAAQPVIDQELGANSLDTLFLTVPENAVVLLASGSAEQGGYQVIHVTARTVRESPAGDFDANSIDPAQLPLAGKFLLRPLVDELGLRISPRYGVWDPVLMAVTPQAEVSVGSQLILARPAAP